MKKDDVSIMSIYRNKLKKFEREFFRIVDSTLTIYFNNLYDSIILFYYFNYRSYNVFDSQIHNRTNQHIFLVNFYFINDIFKLFVNVHRENDNNNKNSFYDFSHDNFNYENHENYKKFETNNYRQIERQQILNFDLMSQMLIVTNILKSKRFFDFYDKKENYLKFHN